MKENKIIPAIVLLVGAAFLLPWRRVEWGKVVVQAERTITVSGQARSARENQIASFSAGVTAVKDDKQEAVAEVNEKINKLVEDVKRFGVEDKDIKTQSISAHQEENRVEKEGVWVSEPGQWRASNTVSIKLRNIDKANGLADLLTASGATNVYGPNFGMDDTADVEKELMEQAVADAKIKAEAAAKLAGAKLGRVITVTEGYGGADYDYAPRMELAGGEGGGAQLEPGSSVVRKSVTVVFELK